MSKGGIVLPMDSMRHRPCLRCGGKTTELQMVRGGGFVEPSVGPCSDCAGTLEENKLLVAEGGVAWRCTDCGAEGAFLPGSAVAVGTRQLSGVEPPGIVGIELGKRIVKGLSCPACRPERIPTREQEHEESARLYGRKQCPKCRSKQIDRRGWGLKVHYQDVEEGDGECRTCGFVFPIDKRTPLEIESGPKGIV